MAFLSTKCGRLWVALLAGIGLLAASTASAQVTQLSEYSFQSGTGTGYDMSGATTLLASGVDDGLSGATNIGFTFNLGGSSYTQFKANSNGYMSVGSGASSSGCCGYSLTSIPTADQPAIVPFSEDLHNGSDGSVSYKLFNSAPNRVLVVNWRTRQYPGSGQATHTTMQARLYETSNRIELWYGETGLTASNPGGMGVIVNSSNFASVNSGVVSYSSATTSTFPSQGTMYSFTPCQSNVAFTGNTSQGGTSSMANNDSLLVGYQVMRGSRGTRTPFTAYNGNKVLNACASRSYQFTISGPHAGDYSISPANGTLPNGSSVIPTITFTPGGTGVREATLTVTDDNGLSVVYKLMGEGVTRIAWSGDVDEGGTPDVMDMDTLINDIQVEFGTSKEFRPIIITDINSDPNETPPARITYTLIDPYGNYSVRPASTSILGGEQAIPVITYNADGIVGIQEATLIVNADGEVRTYLLRAFNAAPGGRLVAEIVGEVSESNPLFVDQVGCVGSEVVSIKITAENTGAGDFIIRGASVYSTDTTIRQGTPGYPFLRDQSGNPVMATDYFISNAPGIAPKKATPAFDSLVVPEGSSRSFYLNMLPTRPGKRYGIAFFNTNAFNLEDENIDGVPTRGNLRAGVFGRGVGSALSSQAGSFERPKPIVFQPTEVRDSRTGTTTIRNNGVCDLLISRSELRFQSGDLAEFEIVSAFPNSSVVGDDYVIAPGMEDQITVRFTPKTYGSRRATIRLATNDSTIGDGSIIERGTFYLDAFGRGDIGLEIREAKLPPAIINGETSHGFVVLENTSTTNVQITSITIESSTGEFIEDAGRPWPTMPVVISPAGTLRLWTELVPEDTAGVGNRSAVFVITLSDGEEIRIPVSAYVGSRQVVVAPTALFTNTKLSVGELDRKYIAVSNIGTVPLRLNDPVLVESNPGEYQVNPLVRRVLEPGQTELIEVTYIPMAPGQSSGTITFSSNATNGDQVVTLGGEATGTSRGIDPSGASIRLPIDEDNQNVSASKTTGTAALSLTAVTPNPVRGTATVTYNVAVDGPVELELYDQAGRLVRVLHSAEETAGQGSVQVSVGDLPSGSYRVVVRQGDTMVSGTMKVVK